jgi:hypothetical protein
MRILIVLLVACGGAAPAAPPAPAPPSHYAGRVGLTGQSWTDVVIEGTDAAAHELCDVLVASQRRTLSRVATGALYTTPCTLDALANPAAAEPYVLVDVVSVTEQDAEMERLLQGRHEPLAAAHGTRTTRVPVADRATCEAMKQHLDAGDAATRDALVQATADFLAQELDRAKQRERDACGQQAAGDPCAEATRQREIIEQKQHAPPPAARVATRSCEPAH